MKSKPGSGTATKSNFPYKAKVSSALGKGTKSGKGKFPYAKKGK